MSMHRSGPLIARLRTAGLVVAVQAFLIGSFIVIGRSCRGLAPAAGSGRIEEAGS